MMGNDTTRNGDEIKTRYAVEILRQHKPAFMTVHLSSLDDAEHAYGVFSPEADQDLEAIDAMLQRLADAARAADPATVVAVVSDHGFTPVTHKVNLYVPFVKAGLITVAPATEGKTPRITSWRAQPWFAGGMAAIMLKDPDDRQTERIVQELLQKLASDPQNGIASIRDRRAAKALGGFPDAAFIVDFSAGYYAGDNMTGELITEIPGSHGGHGFSPELPAMRAAFFVAGSGIARHRDLGVINMLQIAPTMAQVLGVTLPTARAAPLNLAP
jgi:predicted AlkP superfamily pyrophosphatase or phosphodiesterase